MSHVRTAFISVPLPEQFPVCAERATPALLIHTHAWDTKGNAALPLLSLPAPGARVGVVLLWTDHESSLGRNQRQLRLATVLYPAAKHCRVLGIVLETIPGDGIVDFGLGQDFFREGFYSGQYLLVGGMKVLQNIRERS
jgi:hypothetical protein